VHDLIRVIDRLGEMGSYSVIFWAAFSGNGGRDNRQGAPAHYARVQGTWTGQISSHGVAERYQRNKSSVLQRVRAVTPHEGVV